MGTREEERSTLELAERMKYLLIEVAKGGACKNRRYQEYRRALMRRAERENLPHILLESATVDDFRKRIQAAYRTYGEREDALSRCFGPLVTLLRIEADPIRQMNNDVRQPVGDPDA